MAMRSPRGTDHPQLYHEVDRANGTLFGDGHEDVWEGLNHGEHNDHSDMPRHYPVPVNRSGFFTTPNDGLGTASEMIFAYRCACGKVACVLNIALLNAWEAGRASHERDSILAIQDTNSNDARARWILDTPTLHSMCQRILDESLPGGKIALIKEVRALSQLGLKESKEASERALELLAAGWVNEEQAKLIDAEAERLRQEILDAD